METKDIFLILSPFIASYLTYFFGFKTKRKEEIIKFKEERYLKLLGEIRNILFIKENKNHHMNLFLNEHRNLWLYGSDEVIQELNKLLSFFLNSSIRINHEELNENELARLIGNLVLSIRKDLGIKSSLKNTDFPVISPLE